MKELRHSPSLLRSLMKFTVYQLLLAAIVAGLATARPVAAQQVMEKSHFVECHESTAGRNPG